MGMVSPECRSVLIGAGDGDALERLVQYIARCPFSLERIIRLTPEGRVVYKAEHENCRGFPEPGTTSLRAGVNRNFQIFDPLDFLAEVTQHIPDTGEHTIRYYGYYSNKSRGMRRKSAKLAELSVAVPAEKEDDTPFLKLCRSRWAALIKKVYEVDPLKCPKCGGEMKIVAFIEKHSQSDVIERILKHCGLWFEPAECTSRAPPRPPPVLDNEYIPIEEFLANF